MSPIMRALLLSMPLVACDRTDSPAQSTESAKPASAGSAADDESERLSVTSAMVFIPKWDGAEGFSPGGKYVISSGEHFGEDGPSFTDGDQLIGLPEDGQPAVVFSIVGASLKSSHVEVTAVDRGGQKFMGEDVTIWVVRGAHRGQPVDAGQVRLMTELDSGHRPSGEGEHALSVALDLNSDGKPDYAEFMHHCKAEAAPYPITEAQRSAWEAEHGETDWDLSCTNVYTIDNGKWTEGERKTPA